MTKALTQDCSECQKATMTRVLKDGICPACLASERIGKRVKAEAIETLASDKKALATAKRYATALPPKEPANKQAAIDAQKEARVELARRELCRRRLMPFVQKFTPNYEAGWVHTEICERLERFEADVRAKKSPRLMLFMPPRHGKSELASRNFPAWYVGRNPTHEIIQCSYAAHLALKFSRKVRSYLRDPDYQKLFPTKLDPDSQAAENWLTTDGGGLLAAGVSGPITGSGCHLGIIDDPVKNREEAESAQVRNSIKQWYTSTFRTRLAPGGGILVIMTRWHDDDLAGWLISEMLTAEDESAEQWEIVRYPAIATEDEEHRKKGEALHPARYDIHALKALRASVGSDWEPLFQQNPIPDDGSHFTRDMIRYYKDRPHDSELEFYTAWDLAIGQKETNDWTVGITIGVDKDQRWWLVDVKRGHWDGMGIVEVILDTFVRWGSSITGIEKDKVAMAIGPFLNKRIMERNLAHFFYEELKTGKRDKVARSRPLQALMRQGMVMIPEDMPWTSGLVEELLRFPKGKHDDQVDSLSWLGQMLDSMVGYSETQADTTPQWVKDLKIPGTGLTATKPPMLS